MPKLCRCGWIVKDKCTRCTPKRSTSSEGHGWDHRKASERHRKEFPLCERCVMEKGVIEARISEDMHHIHKISEAPTQRMDWNNWLAVCRECHEELEGNPLEGMKVKKWSVENYKWVVFQ